MVVTSETPGTYMNESLLGNVAARCRTLDLLITKQGRINKCGGPVQKNVWGPPPPPLCRRVETMCSIS